jgi:enoyl-CoA hydratase/carnithine racemase
MGEELKSHRHGATLVLTLSNPGLGNALGPAIYSRGLEILEHAAAANDIRSIVMCGEGSRFSAGGNLRRLQANRQEPKAVQVQSIERLHGWVSSIRAFPKPVIAAVEGAAAGAGFSLALACDLIVAAEDAIFLMAYSTIGLSPDGGASWSLSQRVPRQLASEWMMLGERISSQRLHSLGVVNQLATPGTALAVALDMAERINARAPNAMQSSKMLLNAAPEHSLAQQLDLECVHFVNNLHHPNAGIGIQAFLNRTKPEFQPLA